MGFLYNIQRFSIHDGPGIRTTVFFKGCNLHCLWCHNPESISFHKEVEFFPDRCIGCGRCFQVCPTGAHFTDEAGVHRIDRLKCDGCLKCVDSCFAEALVGVGNDVTVDGLMKSILTDLPYFERSGGGVTFSGGECMAQVDFLAEALKACKAHGIHTAVDTAGNVPWASFEKVLESTDLFLYDLKAADSDVHQKLTGAGNGLIIENLQKLCAAGKRVVVRIPYIPGMNEAEMAGIAHILKGLPVEKVELLPYHRLGEGKYNSLGLGISTKPIAVPAEQEMQSALQTLREHGIHAERG